MVPIAIIMFFLGLGVGMLLTPFLSRNEGGVMKNKKSYQHFSIVNSNIQIPKATFNKDKFFNKEFIWMSDSFQKNILPEIEQEITSANYALTSLQLTQSLSDFNIRKDIGEDEVVTPHQWAQEMCTLMNQQSSGQEGPLLTSGYANISYVQLSNGTILAVSVDWLAGSCQWHCDMWELGDDIWAAGDGFFVRG